MNARHGHRQQPRAFAMLWVQFNLKITHQLLGLINPHIGDFTHNRFIASHHGQTARIAPCGHVKMLSARHWHDFRMAFAI